MVRRCVKKSSGQEYAAKIINTKKLSARGMVTPRTLTQMLICAYLPHLWCLRIIEHYSTFYIMIVICRQGCTFIPILAHLQFQELRFLF